MIQIYANNISSRLGLKIFTTNDSNLYKVVRLNSEWYIMKWQLNKYTNGLHNRYLVFEFN